MSELPLLLHLLEFMARNPYTPPSPPQIHIYFYGALKSCRRVIKVLENSAAMAGREQRGERKWKGEFIAEQKHTWMATSFHLFSCPFPRVWLVSVFSSGLDDFQKSHQNKYITLTRGHWINSTNQLHPQLLRSWLDGFSGRDTRTTGRRIILLLLLVLCCCWWRTTERDRTLMALQQQKLKAAAPDPRVRFIHWSLMSRRVLVHSVLLLSVFYFTISPPSQIVVFDCADKTKPKQRPVPFLCNILDGDYPASISVWGRLVLAMTLERK